jgi:AcrR family transcriptional regulator
MSANLTPNTDISPTTAPIRRRQEERTALSDRLLREAAISLLIERGIAGTTLAAIGERSGYSRGLVTHRFGSKAGLLAYIHDTVAAQWTAHVKDEVGESVGMEALRRVIRAVYGFLVDEPDAMRAMYLLRYASIDPSSEYRANVSKVHRAQKRDVQRWLEAGQVDGGINSTVQATLAAELFCASLDGLLYRWLVSPEIPVEKLHRQFSREVGLSLGVPAAELNRRRRSPDRRQSRD